MKNLRLLQRFVCVLVCTSQSFTFIIVSKTLTADSASECTPSETALTDDEVVVRKDLLSPEQQNANAKYDYFEPVDSASSLSTPSEHPYDQFASLNLGNTVIRLDRVSM